MCRAHPRRFYAAPIRFGRQAASTAPPSTSPATGLIDLRLQSIVLLQDVGRHDFLDLVGVATVAGLARDVLQRRVAVAELHRFHRRLQDGVPNRVAEDVDGEALATLVLNKLRGTLNVLAVKAPGFGDRRKSMLQDLAVLTGGTVISEDVGRKLETVTIADLGRAGKVVSTKDDTTVVDGAGDDKAIQGRIAEIKVEIENSTSEYDSEKLQERELPRRRCGFIHR